MSRATVSVEPPVVEAAPVPPATAARSGGHPDVYFSPAYGHADSSASGGQWLGIERYDGHFQMPLLVRPVTGDLCDATSPYGYSGVYASPDLTPDDVRRAWESVKTELRDQRIVSLFLRHSPLVPQAVLPFPHVPVVTGHPTVGMAVRDPATAWAEMNGTCRNTVRKAQKLGCRVELAPAERADLMAGGDFRRLYEETMRRRSASDFYFFPDEYYTRLLSALGPRLLMARGLDAEGAVQSASLFMVHGDFVHYHLSGSGSAAARSGLNNLVLWTVAERSADLGAAVLHLGGGVTRGDGLESFKASFGPHRYTYRTTGVVIDHAAYAALARERRGGAQDDGFFPAYRGGAGG